MLENNTKKEQKVVNNEAYKERFQFILMVDDNIICQRYFRINGYNADSLKSIQFRETMDEIVELIQQDIVSKSRIFMSYTRDEPIKLTGFVNDYSELTYEDVVALTMPEYATVQLNDGRIVNKTYFSYTEGTEDSYSDDEKLNEWDVTFKFMMLVDDKPVYEAIWDGSVYPKYVRNGVDLTNSDILYRDKDAASLHFGYAIIRHMTYGKNDLVYHIIRQICEVMSYKFEDSGKYVKRDKYGDKNYYLSTYNKDWIDAANKSCLNKTRAYEKEFLRYPDTYGLTPGQYEYIENYL